MEKIQKTSPSKGRETRMSGTDPTAFETLLKWARERGIVEAKEKEGGKA